MSRKKTDIDPQEHLDTIRELAEQVTEENEDSDEAVELAELIQELDSHIKNGGQLPEDWDNDSEPN